MWLGLFSLDYRGNAFDAWRVSAVIIDSIFRDLGDWLMSPNTMTGVQLDADDQMLRDSVSRWAQAQAGAGDTQARWQQMADFGWLAMTLPEAHEGLGQGLAQAAVLHEALGAAAISEPLIPAIALGAALIARADHPAAQADWLPAIASGESVIVPAVSERGSGWRPQRLQTQARASGSGWRLDGVKQVVAAGHRADAWLVAAELDQGSESVPDFGLFIVTRGLAGVSSHAFQTVDGAGACRLVLDGVQLDASACLVRAGRAAWEHAADRALVLACAESVGAMDALLRTTADYLRTRVQFGRPLATNQVLRHRMADFKVGCEEARSMTQAAVLAMAGSSDELDALVRARIASGARAKVGALARRACEEAIQLHGGMGVTEELPVGVYLKRQLALDAMLGSPDWHLRRHASLRAAIAARNIEKGAGQ